MTDMRKEGKWRHGQVVYCIAKAPPLGLEYGDRLTIRERPKGFYDPYTGEFVPTHLRFDEVSDRNRTFDIKHFDLVSPRVKRKTFTSIDEDLFTI
jgi:hypothetical protein